jgi:hypothetical protein
MKDLLKLYSFESVHGTPEETAIADWIESFLRDHNIPFTRQGNNLYNLTYEDTPILSAHLDQVKTNGKAEHFVMTPEQHIIAYNKDWERTSLGGDDKNGVWIILKTLLQANVNFIISAGEEVGCVGIKEIDLTPIEKLDTFCIVLDRRGSQDVLNGGGSTTYCSTLAQDICNYLRDMSVTTGSLSDTATICEFCESVNMSVAYEAPHTAKEHTDWRRLQEISSYVLSLVTDFVHYPTPPEVYCKYRSSIKDFKSFNWGDYYNG